MRPEARWDLSALFADDRAATAATAALARDARRFAAGLGERPGADALAALDQLVRRHDELAAYAYLRVLEDAPGAADLEVATTAALTGVVDDLTGVEEAFAALAAEERKALLAGERAAAWREPLRRSWERPRLAPEAEAALRVREPAVLAWGELHARLLTSLTVDVDGERLSYEAAFSLVDDHSRDVRLGARRAIADAVAPHLTSLAACVDAVVADRLALARQHRLAPLDAAAFDDGLDAATVEAVAVELDETLPLQRRLVAAKAALLGLPRLSSVDLFAPVCPLPRIEPQEAAALVAAVAERAAPELGALVDRLFESRVDLEPRPGKGRTVAIGVSRSAAGFVLASYTGTVDDLLVLAHEVGHAVHYELAFERQPHLAAAPVTTVTESAALLFEGLMLDELVARASGAARVALEVLAVERRLAATAVQGALFRFEESLYAARADGLVLDAERLSELWHESRLCLYGPELEPGPGFREGWTNVGHVLDAPFYNYQYAVAEAVAASVRRSLPATGPEPLLALLRAGGSAPTAELLALAGVDDVAAACRGSRAGLAQRLAAVEQLAAGASGASTSPGRAASARPQLSEPEPPIALSTRRR